MHHDLDDPDLIDGVKFAVDAMNSLCRNGAGLRPVRWQDYAPPWAQEPGPRHYQWLQGFLRTWNALAEPRGWPPLPYIFQRPT